MTAPDLRLGRILLGSRANGPGLRDVFWVAGCPIRCPGCVNAHLLDDASGIDVPLAVLREFVDERASRVGGITISGGEPTVQAAGVIELARHARARGLGVVLFTGRTAAALAAPSLAPLRDACDLVVAGPYMAGRPARAPLLGSANQELLFVTDRYCAADLEGLPRVEVLLGPEGITATGVGVGE